MQFELDSDQAQLQDSLRRLLVSDASFERRRLAVSTPTGWSADLWRSMGELGVNALALPEACGGFAWPPIAWYPVLRELGRSLAVQPFLCSTVLAGTAIEQAGTRAQQADLLPGIAQGSHLFAFAHDEPSARHSPLWVETTARPAGPEWRLTGTKQNVIFGAFADTLVLSARIAGAPHEPEGLALFLVQPSQEGVRQSMLKLVDDTPVTHIELHEARAQRLGREEQGWHALRATLDAGIAAICAETLGVVERAYELTVEYVQTRQQFGRPIGANQAVRHRIAEMHVALDMVRSAAHIGLSALELDDAPRVSSELSRAKILAARHGTFIAQQAIQLHGGIGMTAEYPVGHALRRLMVLEQLFGDGPTHAARLGARLSAEAR